MLKTAIGAASDLESAIQTAVAEYNNTAGTKEYHSTQFLIDNNTMIYLVVIMYTVFEQTSDLPPADDKKVWYIGNTDIEEDIV